MTISIAAGIDDLTCFIVTQIQTIFPYTCVQYLWCKVSRNQYDSQTLTQVSSQYINEFTCDPDPDIL